jgi:hypothetical protein
MATSFLFKAVKTFYYQFGILFFIKKSTWLHTVLEIKKNCMPIELCKISEMQEKAILQPENIYR